MKAYIIRNLAGLVLFSMFVIAYIIVEIMNR